jgi:NAD(P)-dependent dehydrogenase (short-subunit alcohol dehydrogenase family)
MFMRTVLITGCSSGFGRVSAQHLAARGWQVLAVVRKDADAESLAAEAAQGGWGDRLQPLTYAITEEEQVRALATDVGRRVSALHGLINNAGTAFPAPLELLPLADLRTQFEINVFAQVAVTQAVLPPLRAAGGTVINVSSMGGRMVFPVTGAYHASKYALEALSDAWRVELRPFGVRVVVVEPGGSPTAIWDRGAQHGRRAVGDGGRYQRLIDNYERLARESATLGFAPGAFARLCERILNTHNPAARYSLPIRTSLLIALRPLIPDRLWDWIVAGAFGWR